MKRERLVVFRSNKYIYGQIIDKDGRVLATASDLELEKGQKTTAKKTERAKIVGKKLAERAIKKGVKRVVFDRRAYQYHGRVKSLAEGAREGGLEF
jgi:large subunit ribosomal protein L18